MTKHRNILIVGATSGIGSAIAQTLEAENYLFLTGRNEPKLRETARQLGGVNTIIPCDLTIEAHIDKLATACNTLDGLVYCGGIAPTLPAKYIRTDDIRQTMAVNFDGAVLVVAALLRMKKINSGASLVFITSEAVRFPFFGSSMYSASKAALEAYSLALATELQSKKIRSNCISPAYVETPMLQQARSSMSPEFIESMKKMHPEAFSSVDKIASLAAFLLSPQAAAINGQILKGGRFNINIPGL